MEVPDEGAIKDEVIEQVKPVLKRSPSFRR